MNVGGSYTNPDKPDYVQWALAILFLEEELGLYFSVSATA